MKHLNIPLEDEQYEKITETKEEEETWIEWLLRAADSLERPQVQEA